jgi:hypothetical protein
MPSVPVPADPGWDDDLAWLDRDPMTPAELEAQLDRLVLGMKGLAYVLCRRASFPWHGILLNWLR